MSQVLKNSVSADEVLKMLERPILDLVFEAQQIHRVNHIPNKVQRSTLLSIKTGACAEDCGYCSQSARYNTGLEVEPLMDKEEILVNAKAAKAAGATRFCMGASWREIPDKELPKLESIVRDVKALGMETCVTLGGCSADQAKVLKEAGLDFYNHNLDSSREFYPNVITTRKYDDRLQTLKNVQEAGLQTCCGGILGMGETRKDRAGLLAELASMEPYPNSVPINQLVPIPGTPLAEQGGVDPLEFVRTVAAARILMPKATIRLSAGRASMSDEAQALCFMAGANSIFYGEKLLTTGNPDVDADAKLFEKLGLSPLDL